MVKDRKLNYLNTMSGLSTPDLIEAYELAKKLELSDEFQHMLLNAIELRNLQNRTSADTMTRASKQSVVAGVEYPS